MRMEERCYQQAEARVVPKRLQFWVQFAFYTLSHILLHSKPQDGGGGAGKQGRFCRSLSGDQQVAKANNLL